MARGKAAVRASVAATHLRHGRYEAALQAAGRAGHGLGQGGSSRRPSDKQIQGTIEAARAEMAMGQLHRARERLEEATVAAPHHLPLRAALLLAADAMGDYTGVRLLLDLFGEVTLDETTPGARAADLIALAEAARLQNDFKRANRLLRAAVRADRRDPTANIMWGHLFLEKHAVDPAVASFGEAMAVDPEHPDTLVGVARLHLERGYDRDAAKERLALALKVNPHHAGALEILGELALDAEEFAEVDRIVGRLRAVNPNAPAASWLAATAAHLHDQKDDFERSLKARMTVRPADGHFFANVADALVRQRRYTDARAMASDCLKVAPKHARCLATLGTTMLRQGDETPGVEMLRRAFVSDPYDARTFNQLELFERTIPQKYITVESEHFRFRIEPRLRPVLQTMISPFLEETYAHFVNRYQHRPTLPITIELYGEASDYAIRTVGLPHLGVAAVCFGRVITAQAPGKDTLNWGMILAHELAHTFAIGLSQERVPRWFTEGLSEIETEHLHAEWSRHDHFLLYGALRTGTLPPLSRLSQAFLQARNADQAVAAYMYATRAVAFLEERFGFAAIRKALTDFGRGIPEKQVIANLAGAQATNLDDVFARALEDHYGYLSRQFLPSASFTTPREEADQRARGRDATPVDLAHAGLAALREGDAADAERWLARARQGNGRAGSGRQPGTLEDPMVAFLAALLAERAGDTETVRTQLQPLLAQGLDGYELRLRLGLAALRAHDLEDAEKHLQKATQLAPEAMEGFALLAQLYDRTGQQRERLHALRVAFALDPQSARLGRDILTLATRLDVTEAIADVAPMLAFIDPGDPSLHAMHGRALVKLGRHKQAIAPLERAFALGHPHAQQIHRELAQIFTLLGETARARAHREQAGAAPGGPVRTGPGPTPSAPPPTTAPR